MLAAPYLLFPFFFLLGLFAIAGSFWAPLLDLDDGCFVHENPLLLGGWSFEAFKQVWIPPPLNPHPAYSHYQPLTYLGMAIQTSLFGSYPWLFRMGNLLCHAASAWLLFRILSQYGGENPSTSTVTNNKPGRGFFLSLSGALFFLLHPTAVESVAWIAERNHVQSLFFCLLAWFFYLPKPSQEPLLSGPPKHGHLGLLAYFLALLSKPMAIGFAPLLILTALRPAGFRRLKDLLTPNLRKREMIHVLSLATLALTFGVFAFGALSDWMSPLTGGSIWGWALTSFSLVGRYILLAAMPWNLSFFYQVEEPLIPWHPEAVKAALVFLFLGFLLWLARLPRFQTSLLILGFLGALAPTLSPRTNPVLFQDRYLYFALPIGIALALLLFQRLEDTWAPRLYKVDRLKIYAWVKPLLALGVLSLLSAVSFQRSFLFANTLLLYDDALAKQPGSAVAHLYYARHLLRVIPPREPPTESRKRFQRIITHAQAVQSAPDRHRLGRKQAVWFLEGAANYHLGHPEARSLLEKAVEGTDAPEYEKRDLWPVACWLLIEMDRKCYRNAPDPAILRQIIQRCAKILAWNPQLSRFWMVKAEAHEVLDEKEQARQDAYHVLNDLECRTQAQALLNRLPP
jgi:hypothetical protein